jgi:hypothetical protein
MELSVIIPAAVTEILKEKPEKLNKCMNCCKYSCNDLTKFICIGCGPREIVDFLSKHPHFAEDTLVKYEKELYNLDNFDFELDEDLELDNDFN